MGAHHDHSHGVSAAAAPRWLWVALWINLGFMAVEIAAGLIANSVALISDAAHMLTDAGAIALALAAVKLAERPPDGRFTFGLKRTEILSAQVNGAALLVLAGVIGFEAVRRIGDPTDVDGAFVIAVGLAGALANGAAALALARANRASLNVEGAFLHNLADLFSSLAAAAAGVLIVTTGFDEADAIAALSVCALMLWGGFGLLREPGRVLLEGTPKGMDAARDRAGHGRPSGRGGGARPAHLGGHVGLPRPVRARDGPAGRRLHARRRELSQLLAERFGIEHATLQVEHERARSLLKIQPLD